MGGDSQLHRQYVLNQGGGHRKKSGGERKRVKHIKWGRDGEGDLVKLLRNEKGRNLCQGYFSLKGEERGK